MRAVIRDLNSKNASGNDLLTNQVLQKLPEREIKFIIKLYNASRWKVAQIIMTQKLGKLAELYRLLEPSSLLPVLKIFENLLFLRLFVIMEWLKLIPPSLVSDAIIE